VRRIVTSILMMGIAILAVTGCVADRSIAVGTWRSADGATIEFFDDGTFIVEQLPIQVLSGYLSASDFPDGIANALGGTWTMADVLDEQFPRGANMHISWDTPPLDFLAGSLWVHDEGGDWQVSFIEDGYFRDDLAPSRDPSTDYTFTRVSD
jgi:hypothetical protein